MAIKTNLAEIKAFTNSEFWVPDGYLEGTFIKIEGASWYGKLDEITGEGSELVTLSDGMYHKNRADLQGIPFEPYFLEWRKSSKLIRMVIEVPKEKEDIVKRMCHNMHGRVL